MAANVQSLLVSAVSEQKAISLFAMGILHLLAVFAAFSVAEIHARPVKNET